MTPNDLTKSLKKGKWHGSYGTACCPAHDDKSPSLSISVGRDGRTLVKCHGGCSQEAVLDALRARGLWSGEASNLRPFAPARPAPVDGNQNGDYALRLWDESLEAKGTVVETYLGSRGLTLPIPTSIRCHPRLKHPDGGTWPAMVALVTNGVTGQPQGIHRTFLKPDGSGKAPVPRVKMMLGPCAGGVVRLAEPGEWLGVGEGIETCLSVMQEAELPVWAALSTSGIKSLELPDTVKNVTIIADADEAGERAAIEAGLRWKAAGIAAMIARPLDGYADMNDMLLKSGGTSI